jgi:hypothetical protein
VTPDRATGEGQWQPSYPLWASSVYAGAIVGTLAASRLSPLLAPATEGWGLPALLRLVEADTAPMPIAAFSLALLFVLVSMLPGLVSLFLITVTDLPPATHPLFGSLFLGVSAGWVTQSFGGAVFGAVFGLVSLGFIAGLLAIRRAGDQQARI